MTLIRNLCASDADFARQLDDLLAFEYVEDETLTATVAEIVAAVKQKGDAALLDYTARFDRFQAASVKELEVSRQAMQAALQALPGAQRQALQTAAARIREYHQRQMTDREHSWSYDDSSLSGARFGQAVSPLACAGLYVPGGRAAYPSSVLMNAIPAKVAGVEALVMMTPTPEGERNPLLLAAAALAGVDRMFCAGGAQAVAALAYGTETVPKVDKITGPGNAYVTAAKRQVFGVVGIDMLAGPSEILIVSDASADPDWLAMDLFSQAEHDELAQSILISPNASHLTSVAASAARLLPEMPRRQIIEKALSGRGALIEVRDLDEACELTNRIAPEHLELALAQPHDWLPKIRHAGAIFCGAYATEALGDYCAGPNHVLPTSGNARFSSPLGVYDFLKRSSLLDISPTAARQLGAVAVTLAEGEGLHAHARSAAMRMKTREAPKLPEAAADARPS